jgi:hypothetical protein
MVGVVFPSKIPVWLPQWSNLIAQNRGTSTPTICRAFWCWHERAAFNDVAQ